VRFEGSTDVEVHVGGIADASKKESQVASALQGDVGLVWAGPEQTQDVQMEELDGLQV
jgi:hypothetical protein